MRLVRLSRKLRNSDIHEIINPIIMRQRDKDKNKDKKSPIQQTFLVMKSRMMM